MKSQNVILHYQSYIVIDEKKANINAIRIYKNEEIEKFEVSFVSNGAILKTFVTKNISIRIISDSKAKIDTIEFLSDKSRVISKIFIEDNLDQTLYKKYISAMSI